MTGSLPKNAVYSESIATSFFSSAAESLRNSILLLFEGLEDLLNSHYNYFYINTHLGYQVNSAQRQRYTAILDLIDGYFFQLQTRLPSLQSL